MNIQTLSKQLCFGVPLFATVAGALTSAFAADYPNAVLADAPLVYYRLNDVTPPDLARNFGSAGAAANGLYITATHRVEGPFALNGNGSAAVGVAGGARVAIPFTPALNPPANTPFTIEAWIKPTAEGAANAQAPLFNRHTQGNRQGWVFFQRASNVGYNFRMYNQNGSTQSVDITGGSYTVGQWSHVVLVWTGTMATLYVDGAAVGSQTAGYVANTDAPFSIGAYGADNPGDNAFTGSIDEVAFYNTALPVARISAHFAGGTNTLFTPIYASIVGADNPVLFLHLDEVDPIFDQSANNGLLGPLGDAENFPGQKHQIPGALAGSSDTATQYTGIDQSSTDGSVPTRLAYQPQLNTPAFTVEAWLQPTLAGAANAQCPLYNRKEGAVRTGWAFFQRAASGAGDKGWNFRMYNGVNDQRSIDLTSQDGYTPGQWYHVAAAFDGTVGNLYVNGALKATQNVVGAYAPNTDSILFGVGGFPNGVENPFTGGIDEVALYPDALTATKVQTHYQNGINPARTTPYESVIMGDGAMEYLRLNEAARFGAANQGSLAAANATYVNTSNATPGPQALAQAGFESDNAAASFNSVNTYMELGNPPGLNFAGQITVEAWVKPDAVQPLSSVIVGHGANDEAIVSDLRLRIENGAYEFGTVNATATFSAAPDLGSGAWVHLVGTNNGTNWTLYRNGVQVATTADPIGSTAVSNAFWAIGARGRWKHSAGYPASGQERVFSGAIDEVAIYNHALSPDRVKAHYITGIATATPLTIARPAGVTTLTWTNGILQQSDNLGTFTDVPLAASPYLPPAGPARKFYRLRF